MTTAKSDKFSRLCKESRKLNEVRDCTVKATAVVTGLPYAEAHALLRRFGRKDRQGMFPYGPNGYHAAIRSLGFEIKRVEKPHPMAAAKTIVTLGRALPSRGVFLVQTRAHVLAVQGGRVHDWTEGRRHRIVSVFRIIDRRPKGTATNIEPTPAPVKPTPKKRPRRARTMNANTLARFMSMGRPAFPVENR